jgi:dTDP-4-amino-4,6-dideoxygalactose transaminase
MRSASLPFSKPSVGEREITEVVDSLRSGWITTGPKVKRFEQEFAQAVGAPAALALSSCTAALHVALKTLGIGHGDSVIASPMTFCSGVNVIEHVGARPVFVDVQPDTLNIDPEKLRQTAKKLVQESNGVHLKAVMPVHLYGHPCEVDALLDIARQYQLAVIEDAAHALPASYKGRMIGSPAVWPGVPALTCFSFYATKNLTTAEGGMLTGQPELVEEARVWGLHGMSRDAWKRYSSEGSWYYEVMCPGFKYNMTDIQAAIGIHQLRMLSAFQVRRREIVRRYNVAFAGCAELQIPAESCDVENAWHLYVLRLNTDRLDISRDRFIEELRARNISTSVHFIPMHLHPYYRDKYGYKPEQYPVAYHEYQRIVSLPLYPGMADQDVEDVIEAVRNVAKQFRKHPERTGRGVAAPGIKLPRRATAAKTSTPH